MNEAQWLKFWLEAFNPVFYNGKRYVDLRLMSNIEYPVLKKLEGFETIEILLLAMLINAAKTFNEIQVEPVAESFIYETFENYDCTQASILNSLMKFQHLGLTQVLVEPKSGETLHKLLFRPLLVKGIIIPNNRASLDLFNAVSEN